MIFVKMSNEKIDLPPLAWVATIRPREPNTVHFYCGNKVEIGLDFVVEGVWPGAFGDADFVESELFYGSGFKLTDDGCIFSCSCSTVDRLWSHQTDGEVTISNSLPCLLAIAGVELLWGEESYAGLVETIVKGWDYQKDFPINKGLLRVHYFENIHVQGSAMNVSKKKINVPPFDCFKNYSDFLFDTAIGIGLNAKDTQRRYPIEVFSTVSRGYDSPVATLMAKAAGASFAYTFSSARSIIPRDDSGTKICNILGIPCKEFANKKENIKEEIWYWAANGTLQDMNFSIFPYPCGVSAIFTGFNGDMVWSKAEFEGENFLKRKDSTGLGFCEHRLVKGVIHCPVPFWGVSRLDEIKNITLSDEMQTWSIGGDYDRPIPRRMLESVGVPRSYFGQKKSATTIDELVLLPMDKRLRASYQRYLTEHKGPAAALFLTPIFRHSIDLWRSVFRERVLSVAYFIGLRPRVSRTYKWERFLFPWANCALKSVEESQAKTERRRKAANLEKPEPAQMRQ